MVVNMIKWRPWPPLSPSSWSSAKKFEAKITIHQLNGLGKENCDAETLQHRFSRLAVEVKWKGSKKSNALSSFKRSVRRNFTKVESLTEDGVVEWHEDFQCVCNFSSSHHKLEGVFQPWEVVFTVFNDLNRGVNNKVSVIATATLNLADFVIMAEEKEIDMSIPLAMANCKVENNPSLLLSLSLYELKTAQEPYQATPKQVRSLPVSPKPKEILSTEKYERSSLKASLRKVNIFSVLSSRRSKKAFREEEGSDGKISVRSEEVEYNYPFDTDSLDDLDGGDSEDGKDVSTVRKSFSYGTLAYVNHAGGSFYSNTSSSEDEDWIYYSNRKPDVGDSYLVDSSASDQDQSSQQSSKRRIWKRKLSFRSPKPKGEPLLKKDFREEGGDDIDFDRRQLSSSDESTFFGNKTEEAATQLSVSEFGDDSFAVGSWEQKEIVSRDGHMKLQTQIFFASIDQRSERAAGESACTALVAVIAYWYQSNPDQMPIKCQLDSLIRDGSLEWRNLCENNTYRERFPDKHFDLETVLQAEVRPLSVVPDKSFIGFFQPEGLEDGGFDFLQGAMSFDSIWDEISKSSSDSLACDEPLLYIVSWNDHFFLLKVEHDAYYIIDTLGERLYEGCNQAFIIKFDKETTIEQLPHEDKQSGDKSSGSTAEENDLKQAVAQGKEIVPSNEPVSGEECPKIICRGKESCKEYIKSFLAAIPIRELQVDHKKGLMASAPLHHRLQIEFHYTKSSIPVRKSFSEARADTTAIIPSVALSN